MCLHDGNRLLLSRCRWNFSLHLCGLYSLCLLRPYMVTAHIASASMRLSQREHHTSGSTGALSFVSVELSWFLTVGSHTRLPAACGSMAGSENRPLSTAWVGCWPYFPTLICLNRH